VNTYIVASIETKDSKVPLVFEVTRVPEGQSIKVFPNRPQEFEVRVLPKNKMEITFLGFAVWDSVLRFPSLDEERYDGAILGLCLWVSEEGEILAIRDSLDRTVSVLKTNSPPKYLPITAAVY